MGWLEAVRYRDFGDYVMRKGFAVQSTYQLTQIITWVLYQLFGADAWAWHILQLSLHALNATLFYSFLKGIFRDSRLEHPAVVAFYCAALFTCSPYVSEVIVWEAAYHFLQGMLLLLVQLWLLREVLHDAKTRHIILFIALFILSLFSLELFYLTPFLGLALCLYYRYCLQWQRGRVSRALRRVVFPQIVLFVVYLVGLRLFLHTDTGRLGNSLTELPITYFLVKPPEYLFHLLGGRFLPQSWRDVVYDACSSYLGAGIFYLAMGALVVYMGLRFKHMSRQGQLMSLLLVWLLMGVVLVSTLWFPEKLLITGDRYLYVLLPFFLSLVVLTIMCRFKRSLLIRITLVLLILLQCAGTWKLSQLWGQAAGITDRLQQSFIDVPQRYTILLNNPASLNGAPMIGAADDNETKLMHNLLYPSPITGQVREAVAMHLLHADDSAQIEVLSREELRVTLLHPGMKWQFGPDVARPYGNDGFHVKLSPDGRSYTLSLINHPLTYRLLFQRKGQWKEVKTMEKDSLSP